MSDTPFTDRHTLKGYPSGEFVPASECRNLEEKANMLAAVLYDLMHQVVDASKYNLKNIQYGRFASPDIEMADAAILKYRCRV